MKNIIQDTQVSYDTVASEYAEKFKDEMDDKPADRSYLDHLAKEVGELGPICDLGCGPGQIARYLHRQGVKTLGVDLSPKMVEEAQRLNPEIHFHQGNMLALPDAENSWGGIAAFYCIIHIPREQIADALRELKRVLKPNGVLLISFHIGAEITHLIEFFEKPVNLDFSFYQPSEMEAWLQEAGFLNYRKPSSASQTHKWNILRKGPIYLQENRRSTNPFRLQKFYIFIAIFS